MSLPTEKAILQEIAKIAEAITGVQFNDRHHDMIKARLQKRCRELGLVGPTSLAGYLAYFHAHREAETPKIIALMTTHHTYFFREFAHFEFLSTTALSEVLAEVRARPNKTLRVWSAASSRGQEAYSLAMYLDFHLTRIDPSIKFEILGTDIDAESVEIAKNGVYLRTELKDAPLSLLGQHWIRGTGDITDYVKAKASLRGKCQFRALNLLELATHKEPHEKFDLIFCRNVFIYFNEKQIRQITEQLLSRLSPAGFLFVGTSESLSHLSMAVNGRGPAIYQHAALAQSKKASIPVQVAPMPQSSPKVERAIRVFCVDDSSSILTLLKRVLSAENGFEIVGTAVNGQEAIEKIATLKPDAVTLDIHMPVMTGIEYLQKAYGPNHPPVIMLTSVSRDNAELAGQALTLGAADFVEKPALSNITERGDEIRAKIRCAITARSLSAKVSTSLDKSFQKKDEIKECDQKLRVVVMSLSQRGKLKSLFSELSGDQPPLFILVDGGKDALSAIAPILTRESGKTVTYVETIPQQVSAGAIYLADLGSLALPLYEQHGKGKASSILIFGEVPQGSAEKILQFQEAQLLLEDLGSGKGTKSLMDAANDVVPATSFGYMSNQFLSQAKPSLSPGKKKAA